MSHCDRGRWQRNLTLAVITDFRIRAYSERIRKQTATKDKERESSMLSRRSTIIIDLFLVLINIGVACFNASRIYGGNLGGGVVALMFASALTGILILLVMLWLLRDFARHDRELASLLMKLVYEHAALRGGQGKLTHGPQASS